VRWCAAHNREGREGQGEVIELSVRPVPLESLDANGELLQSGYWGFFKQAFGWQAHPFEVRAGDARFGLLVLTRRLFRLFALAYVPFGPGLDPWVGGQGSRGELLAGLAAALRPHLPATSVFIRFDLPWAKTGESPLLRRRGARVRKSANDMQPATTVLVDIRPLEDQILAGMKPKTRYNAKLAAKKGVEVAEGAEEDFDSWYSLYRETSARDRIAIHAPSYYRGLFTRARSYPGKAPAVKLLLARHDGELLAGNIVVLWKKTGIYLTGASSNEKRNLMPTYALQWEAMRMAKAAGCETYDLYGIPPAPDPGHPMHGLYQFKAGFSEMILERWGSWDVPFRPVLFSLYRAAEAARMFWHRSLKKRLRRRA
jgi:lipid II:glycine glycyltransferase (peptidoglycan interpeptide bridge formation enzyme)